MAVHPWLAPRPAPPHPSGGMLGLGGFRWRQAARALRQRPLGSLLGVLGLGLAAWATALLLDWALWHAVWRPDAAACDALRGQGACWGMLVEKAPLILWGRFPLDQSWRPLLATGVLLALVLVSALPRCWNRHLLWLWGLAGALFLGLMGGGVAGLSRVPTERWGGLPLTLLISTVSIALAFPLGVALALGRRARLPVLRALCTVYIECVRGVPLIAVLFMASFMFPLLLPPGTQPDVLLRVTLGISLFAAAYLAETVRGGLRSIAPGQLEAAASLGLNAMQTLRTVVLPQALIRVLPGLINSFISIFKDSSLITIVSLYELTGSLGLALSGDPVWRPYLLEGYVLIGAIYFVFCAAFSRYSLWLEAQQPGAQRRAAS